MGRPQIQPVVRAALLGFVVLGCHSRAVPSLPKVARAPHAVAPPYRVVHGWPHVPPGELFGQVSGVGIDAQGDVLVFRRASRSWLSDTPSTEPIAEPKVLRFSAQTGELTATWARTGSLCHTASVWIIRGTSG
jgi:hypothetical protein